jgi:CO dehydrogenase maturation factor
VDGPPVGPTVPVVRVAFVGKGGAGKSSLAGTFARLLARTGERVLALDSDPMPGLAFSLGVGVTDAGLPDDAVEPYEERGRRRYRLRAGLTGPDVVDRYAVRGPDGVHFLQLGKARGPRWDNSRQHFGFQGVLDDLPGDGWSIVGDLPGGTRQPFMTWGRYARIFLVVVEPSTASLLSGRRLARLAEGGRRPRVLAVANKIREPDDRDLIAAGTGLEVVGCIPMDRALADADRRGLPVVDAEPDAPAVAAVRSLVDVLREREVSS